MHKQYTSIAQEAQVSPGCTRAVKMMALRVETASGELLRLVMVSIGTLLPAREVHSVDMRTALHCLQNWDSRRSNGSRPTGIALCAEGMRAHVLPQACCFLSSLAMAGARWRMSLPIMHTGSNMFTRPRTHEAIFLARLRWCRI